MIAIYDKETDPNKFVVAELLRAIVKHAGVAPDDQFRLTRWGGIGERVWNLESQLESRLNAGESVTVSIEELLPIASDSGEYIDEMHCINDNIQFGLSDASFLFFQAADKAVESKIAAEFRQVTYHADFP